jgi:hypothetical protein
MWFDSLPPHLMKGTPKPPPIPVQQAAAAAAGHAGKKRKAPSVLKGAKMAQPADKGDRSAFIELSRADFAQFCDRLSEMSAAHILSGVPITFDAVKAVLGHAPLATSHWSRTVVTCEGDDDLDVAVVIGKAGAFGHRQLIEAVESCRVKIGVVIANGLANLHYITGDHGRQCAQLVAFSHAVKRTTGIKSKKAVHTALLCTRRVERICSFHGQTLKDRWGEEGTELHTSMACPSCDDVVLASSIRRRKNPVVPLCSACHQVPGFKGSSYARPRHTLPSDPTAVVARVAPHAFLYLPPCRPNL